MSDFVETSRLLRLCEKHRAALEEENERYHEVNCDLRERVVALEEALRHVVNDSPGTSHSMKQYLRVALAAQPGEREA